MSPSTGEKERGRSKKAKKRVRSVVRLAGDCIKYSFSFVMCGIQFVIRGVGMYIWRVPKVIVICYRTAIACACV